MGGLLDHIIVAGLVLLVVAFALVMAIYGTPRHAAGCKNPDCTGCSGGPH